MEKHIEIEERIKESCPNYALIYLEADIKNKPTDDNLKQALENLSKSITELYEIPMIARRGPIAATRAAYKAFGKDPNRYRPSQEQLMRRILKGQGLYEVNQAVDSGNLLSLTTGCSVGVFDRDKIEGNMISVGVGAHDEPYEGLGRGPLNIEGLPVLRDARGGFGTPTSDHERTKAEKDMQHLSVTVHVFDSTVTDPEEIRDQLLGIFSDYNEISDLQTTIIK